MCLKMAHIPIVLIWCLFIPKTQSRLGLGDYEQDWGYVTVRPHAHMFWWLFYTTATNYTERPLIIWLQGGPGMPASGYGNFVEIGPLNVSLHKREDSFVNHVNVLFIDNPVGVGFSYVSENTTKLSATGEEIGLDLVTFLKIFMETKVEFQQIPLYIFGESYGGKMAVEFVHQLVKNNENLYNLKGIALGDSYISPSDYVQHYAPIALQLGLVDKQGFARIDELAKQIQVLINKKEFIKAADIESKLTDILAAEIQGIDIYNILARTNTTLMPKFIDHLSILEDLTNLIVKKSLALPNITWSFFQYEIHDSLKGDLMRSVTHKVENILNNTDIKVIVYNGNLDFIVNTAGTIGWLENLNWSGKDKWRKEKQIPLEINMIYEGYYRKVQNLVFYSILRAGHSIPVDNMPVMSELLKREILQL